MSRVRRELGERGIPVRWLARVSSIAVSGVFILILVLAVTNEDKPQGAAIPVLALLGLTLVATHAAWRWEKAGGLAVVFLSLCLSVAAYSASRTFGLGSLSFVPALLYGVPFVVVGILFWVSAQGEASRSHPDLGPPPPVMRRWWFIGAMLAALVALAATVVALLIGVRVGG